MKYCDWKTKVVVAVVVVLSILFWGGIVRKVFSAEREIVIKGIPDTITDQECLEWISVLIERKYMVKIQQIPELQAAQKTAQEDIDNFRKANKLSAKFEQPATPQEEK